MTTEIVLEEHSDNIAMLKLNQGVTNPINQELVNQLTGSLKKVRDESEVRGIVLRSTNDKFFSIGLDIPSLFELSREDFTDFYKAYNRLCLDLYTMPKPTVAAITGHAIAGGCILTLCCDYRIISEGKKLMGLNEIKLGVPVPYPADRILLDIAGSLNAREITGTGEFYQPEDALDLGLVDQILPTDQVLQFAIGKARQLAEMPPEAFQIIKRNRIENVESQILANLEQKEQQFIDRWYAEETREKLREAMESF